MSSKRKFNFSPGPGALPESVLERAQASLLDHDGTGVGILETSHRSPAFDKVINGVRQRLSRLMELPEDREILLLQGGASLQFAMVPMNLAPAGTVAEYVDTGAWSDKAAQAAQKVAQAKVICSTKQDGGYARVPAPSEIQASADAAYLHLTSNNTIFGTQFHEWPDVGADGPPVVVDMSSDILSRRLDASRFDLIYAGAQKNLGPAGLTIVIISKRLLDRASDALPPLLSYRTLAKKESLFNTPPVFSIFVTGLVLEWLEEQGGVDAIEAVNKQKGELLYGAIDESDGFYRGTADKGSRSLMNVMFRLPSPELDKKFVAAAGERDFVSLKGHRSTGGIRVSTYNAVSVDAVTKLVEFMRGFAKQH